MSLCEDSSKKSGKILTFTEPEKNSSFTVMLCSFSIARLYCMSLPTQPVLIPNARREFFWSSIKFNNGEIITVTGFAAKVLLNLESSA